jgi:ABC-2 type transport system permease protein
MIGLYWAFARISFLTQLEYRGQYFMRMVAKILGWSTGFIMLMVLLKKFRTVGGWSIYEILFLYAFDVISYSIASTFCMGSFGKLPGMIRKGELDGILTKPVNPFVYLVSTKISAGYTSNYAIALGIMVFSIRKLGISINGFSVVWLFFDIIGASLIQAAGYMVTTVPAFWFYKSDGLYRLFYKNLTDFLKYPLSIYHRGVQALLTFILPYAFINFYPVQYFIHKQEGMFSSYFQYLTPLVGLVTFSGAYCFWLKGLRAYKSTGS